MKERETKQIYFSFSKQSKEGNYLHNYSHQVLIVYLSLLNNIVEK